MKTEKQQDFTFLKLSSLTRFITVNFNFSKILCVAEKKLKVSLKKNESPFFKMSFICPKCSKQLSSKERLQKHLEKTYSCVMECCGYTYKSKTNFLKHKREAHPRVIKRKKKTNDELEMMKLKVQMQQLEIEKSKIDLENNKIDLEKGKLEMEKAKEQRAIEPIERIPMLRESLVPFEYSAQYLIDGTNHITCEQLETKHFVKTKIVIENTRRKLTDEEKEKMSESIFGMQDLVGGALSCLASTKGSFLFDNVNQLLHRVLGRVHVNKNHPELWNVMLSDKSRMMIKFFSQETQPPSWIKLPKEHAIQKISKHARDLVRDLIEAALLQMKPFLVGTLPVFGCMGKTETIVIHLHNQDDHLTVKTIPNEMLTVIPSNSPDHIDLIAKIQRRKHEIVSKIDLLIFQDSNIIHFLQQCETVSHLAITDG